MIVKRNIARNGNDSLLRLNYSVTFSSLYYIKSDGIVIILSAISSLCAKYVFLSRDLSRGAHVIELSYFPRQTKTNPR